MIETTAIAGQIIDFLTFSERLKKEMRHSYLSDSRQESVAEHSWQMSLMALLSYQYLSTQVDILRVLKMIVVHDLIEAEAGDVSYLDQLKDPSIRDMKVVKEKAAIEKIRQMLPSPVNEEIYALWHEFEDLETCEAKFAKALDDMEVQVQHNLASFDTWEEKELELSFVKTHRNCSHDPFLIALADAIVQRTEQKMSVAGMDINAIRQKALA